NSGWTSPSRASRPACPTKTDGRVRRCKPAHHHAMGWTLAPNVHFCTASERVVFLDTARDRYFALPGAQSAAFCAWIDSGKPAPAPPVAQLLIDAHLLEAREAAGSPRPAA